MAAFALVALLSTGASAEVPVKNAYPPEKETGFPVKDIDVEAIKKLREKNIAPPSPVNDADMVRVLLSESKDSIKISSDDTLILTDLSSGKKIAAGNIKSADIRKNSRGLMVNKLLFPSSVVKIETRIGTLSFAGKKYRGNFTVHAGNGSTVKLVNNVDIDDYLFGVVPSEMPAEWPMEALKAQAIASRTYTLYRIEESRKEPSIYHDVVATVGDQVYGGMNSENERTSVAVYLTKGMALKYNNRIVKAYYHSTSSTRTESGMEVFAGEEVPYLKGVSCTYAKNSPYSSWKETIGLDELEDILARNGYRVGNIINVSASGFTSSGRIHNLNIHTLTGVKTLKATEFRRAVGTTRIKSTWFRIRKSGNTITLSGRGYGHGVGLCQWGAKEMASKDFGYTDILSHYYPGTEISPTEFTFLEK